MRIDVRLGARDCGERRVARALEGGQTVCGKLRFCRIGQRAVHEIGNAGEFLGSDRVEQMPGMHDEFLTRRDVRGRAAQARDNFVPRRRDVLVRRAVGSHDRQVLELREDRVDDRLRRRRIIFFVGLVHGVAPFQPDELRAQELRVVVVDKGRAAERNRRELAFPTTDRHEVLCVCGE